MNVRILNQEQKNPIRRRTTIRGRRGVKQKCVGPAEEQTDIVGEFVCGNRRSKSGFGTNTSRSKNGIHHWGPFLGEPQYQCVTHPRLATRTSMVTSKRHIHKEVWKGMSPVRGKGKKRVFLIIT